MTSTAPPVTPSLHPLVILRTARPHQWVKNLFVAAPLVFARRIDDLGDLARAGVAVACFCVLSSAVYFLNDLLDIEKDRAHPVKRHRPIASGALSVSAARALLATLCTAALTGALLLSSSFALAALAYFTLNVAYSLRLKRVAFVDVLCIAAGFLLRVIGGAQAIGVPPSPWLLAVTLLLASMLGFGKRAHELRVAGARGQQRDVLERYHPGVLRGLLYGLGVATIAAYSAYTQSAHALDFFGTRLLAITVPSVALGITRFVWITLHDQKAESPTDSMLRDRLFLANLAVYAGAILYVIYGA